MLSIQYDNVISDKFIQVDIQHAYKINKQPIVLGVKIFKQTTFKSQYSLIQAENIRQIRTFVLTCKATKLLEKFFNYMHNLTKTRISHEFTT